MGVITELVRVELVKAVAGRPAGRILDVPPGTAEMWIGQGKARRLIPGATVEVDVRTEPRRRGRATTA